MEVLFIDYGNRDTVSTARMRPLEPSLAAAPPLARECMLAMVRAPALGTEFGTAAATLLSDAAFGRRMAMKAHGPPAAPGAPAYVSLWDLDSGACVQEAMVEAGLARVAAFDAKRVARRTPPAGIVVGAADKDADLLARLRAATEIAKKERAALFAYGEPSNSDDERAMRK